MASGSVKRIQTVTTKQITTNSNGIANLGMTVNGDGYVIAIFVQDLIAIPFIVGSGQNWWVKVLGWSNMSPYEGTLNVTVVTQ